MKRGLLFLTALVPLVAIALIAFLLIKSPETLPKQESLPAISRADSNGVEKASNQELVTKRTFGYSENGRAIDGYEIGDGAECVLFFGGIHGNEKGAVSLLQQFANEILTSPELVSSTKRVIILPLLNPDGYYQEIYRDNANGVNINRNFTTPGWTAYPDEETFAGTEPFSEAETRLLRDVVQECEAELMIAFHSQGGVISPEASPESIALADWYASKTGYTIYNDWNYPGTATQWFMSTTGNPAITVEMTSHDKSDWDINRSALLELIRQ